MDLFWIIYFIGMVDGLLKVTLGAAIICGVLIPIVGAISSIEGEWDKAKPYLITGVKVFIVSVFVSIFVPAQSTAYKMLAAYGVTEAYAAAQSSDKVKAIAGKSLEVLEKAMDDYLTKEEK